VLYQLSYLAGPRVESIAAPFSGVKSRWKPR